MTVTPTGVANKNRLDFTATGSYVGIRNFVYSLEEDEDLNFRIENFKLTTGTSAENLSGTFTVNDIGIKQETTSTNVSSGNNTNNNSNTTTNTNNTENVEATEANTENTTNTTNSRYRINSADDNAADKIDAAVGN